MKNVTNKKFSEIAEYKTKYLPKNPARGGIPAKENNTIKIKKAKGGFK
jgi:hypothetical protein